MQSWTPLSLGLLRPGIGIDWGCCLGFPRSVLRNTGSSFLPVMHPRRRMDSLRPGNHKLLAFQLPILLWVSSPYTFTSQVRPPRGVWKATTFLQKDLILWIFFSEPKFNWPQSSVFGIPTPGQVWKWLMFVRNELTPQLKNPSYLRILW